MHGVNSRRQQNNAETALVVCSSGSLEAGLLIYCRDRGTGHRGFFRIKHAAFDVSRGRLRLREGNRAECHQQEDKNIKLRQGDKFCEHDFPQEPDQAFESNIDVRDGLHISPCG